MAGTVCLCCKLSCFHLEDNEAYNNSLKVDVDAFFMCNKCVKPKGKKKHVYLHFNACYSKFCVQLTKLQSGLQYRVLATVTHANPPLSGTSGLGHFVGSAPWHAINHWSFNKLVYVVSCSYCHLQPFFIFIFKTYKALHYAESRSLL